MKATYRHWVVALVLTGGVLAAGQAFADPPGRVARLNYLKGSVSFRPATVEEWGAATVNYPLATGDHLWTDENAWAEMHVGSTAIRLAPTTAFAFLNLDDRTIQVRLSEGAIDVRVRNLDGGDVFEIATPSASVALTRPGVYRVDVLPDGGSTRVTARHGVASVSADSSDFYVRDGETAAIYGTDEATHEIYRAAAPDSWERWCRARDEREDAVSSVRYVSYEMTGYEDLDEYGSWSSLPDYGWAWRPRVSVGWAPYRYGQWRWVYPWGWTWVDEAPWGFAPFHYGRWAHHHGNWWWVPGRYVVRPVYAPALVAFIGGDNWGLSIGFGRSHVGWFPLAPGEFWMPHYHASHTYIRNLNVTHVNVTNVNITNYNVSRGTYVNRAIAGAVTAVPRDGFIGGRAVARNAVAVDSRVVMRAPVVGTSAPLAPRAESIVDRRGGYAARPSASALARPVVARSQPPAAPAPFAAQERALQANGGRPLDEAAMERLRGDARGRSEGAPVRIAGARGGALRGAPSGSGAGVRAEGDRPDAARGDAARVDRPSDDSSRSRAGVAIPRGDRAGAGESRPGGAMGAPGAARPETNDRPSWARPRAAGQDGASAGAPPMGAGGYGDSRAGVRGRPGTAAPDAGEVNRGGGVPSDRPGGMNAGEARPRGGDRAAPGDAGRPSNDRPSNDRPSNDRPSFGRPSAGERGRGDSGGGQAGAPPSGGAARPRGGEARPAPSTPPSRPPGDNNARPRGRGGDSAFYEPSSRPSYSVYANDRPPEARSFGGARPSPAASPRSEWPPRAYGSRTSPESRAVPQYRPAPDSRPAPQYRSAPEASRPTPQYRGVPEYRSAPEARSAPQYRPMPDSRPMPQYRSVPDSRPAPQYRGVPEYRSAPEARSAPQYRPMPDSRPMPQYRSVPDSRPAPQYRSMPESRPMPQYRSVPESRPMPSAPSRGSYGGGGAVPRGGGGGERVAPAPRGGGSSGGGQSRGSARGRGRNE